MNDPTSWNPDPDTGTLAFASPEDAKKAAALFKRVQDEAFNAGLEAAAKVCETAPDLLQNSTFDGAAEAIRALKRSSDAASHQEISQSNQGETK